MSESNKIKFELHIQVDQPQKAVDLLLVHCQAHELGGKLVWSKQKIKQVMHQGAVWLTSLNGKQTTRLRRGSKEVLAGQTLHCYFDEKVLNSEVPVAQLLADCGHYSVWYKPCGMLSQGSKWGDFASIVRYAEQHIEPPRPSFIVHRLDRATTGLILVGHSKKATAALAAMFQSRQLSKYYLAIVHGQFAHKLTIDEPIDDKRAVSHVSLRQYDHMGDVSLVEVKIDTGRKHQIRRHLSGIGHGIVGDRLYGNDENNQDLQLTAYKLHFLCPIEQLERSFVLPEDKQLKLSLD